uniref:Uncharacterized protein n=1 Tax=Rhizophora mucronata TaxID=61149 RepID=A0A2P2QZW7_RHIMU
MSYITDGSSPLSHKPHTPIANLIHLRLMSKV